MVGGPPCTRRSDAPRSAGDLRRPHHGTDRGRRLSPPGRGVAARGRDLRQVPGGQPDQRGRGRGPLRPAQRGHHPHRPGPLRRVPARRPARLRGRRPLRDRRARPADPGDLLRDLPARRLPALLLPLPQGPRPRDPPRGAGPGRDPGGPGVLGDGDRALPGAQPQRHPGRPGGPARRSPASPSSTWTTGRCSGRQGGGPAVGSGRWSTSRSRSGTSTSATPPSASASRGRRRALRDRGVEVVVVKQGPKGCWPRRETEVEVPPVPVEVVNGLGAGDAFGGRSATGCWPAGTWSG